MCVCVCVCVCECVCKKREGKVHLRAADNGGKSEDGFAFCCNSKFQKRWELIFEVLNK